MEVEEEKVEEPQIIESRKTKVSNRYTSPYKQTKTSKRPTTATKPRVTTNSNIGLYEPVMKTPRGAARRPDFSAKKPTPF
jgi:hypothetical protein